LRSLIFAPAALVAIFVGSLVLSGQGNQPSPQAPSSSTPTFRSSAEAVQVTAMVTDARGEVVKGLTEADFEVLENGVVQPITTFSEVNIPIQRAVDVGPETDVLGNDRPDGRLYLIALDEVAPENALKARHFLREFIEDQFGPNDTAAIVLIGRGLSTSGQEFTSNRRLLLEAIDKFSGGFGDDPLNARNKMGTFRDLMEFMAKLPGPRKVMIMVSEGIGADATDLVDYRGGVLSISGEDFQQAVSAATRGNVAIYPIDPRGLDPAIGGAGVGNDLRALAAVTGGFAVTNSNGFKAAFERIVQENSSYYMLGFNSSNEKRNARYVNVTVRVRRPGLQVRSVNGYVAPRGTEKVAKGTGTPTTLPAVWSAAQSPLTTSGVPMKVFAAPFKRTEGKDATIAIALEINVSRLNLVESDGAYRGDLEIIFAVTDAAKRRHQPIRHRATLSLKPETYEQVKLTGLRVISQLALPKGSYQLRVAAGQATLAGSVAYDLRVPDFADDLSMSGVSVTSRYARRTVTFSPDKTINVALPGPPITERDFGRDDALTLFFEVYENRRKAHTIDLTTQLRKDSGVVMVTMTTQRKAAETKQATVHQFSPSLSLEDLPAGRYSLRLEARSSLDKNNKVTRDVPFRVH